MIDRVQRAMAPFVLAALTAGCGSQLSSEELERSLGPIGLRNETSAPAGAGDRPGQANEPVAAEPGGSVAAPGAPVGTPPAATSGGGGGTSSATGAGATAASAPAAVAPNAASTNAPAASAAPAGPGAAPPPVPGAAAGAGASKAGPKAEIRLGSVGVQSGALGQIMLPFFQGARAWAADVNARGGLNGHPLRMIVADDAGDPSKALALVRRMVELDKVHAFYTVPAPTTLQAMTPFLEQAQVPVIGTCECNPAAGESPMVFHPGIGAKTGLAWAHLAPMLELSDKRKAALFYCREVPSCEGVAGDIRRITKQVGIELVYEAQVSIAQPDYTAEVLAARNAGAEAITPILDNASITRVLRSAHRQNYRPVMSAQTSSYEVRFLEAGGSTLGAEMWGAGKLVELLVKGFPANAPGPTSQHFLDAFHALSGETVGGLFPPLAFTKGTGHEATNQCVITVEVVDGTFVPKSDDQFSCAPGWKPVGQ